MILWGAEMFLVLTCPHLHQHGMSELKKFRCDVTHKSDPEGFSVAPTDQQNKKCLDLFMFHPWTLQSGTVMRYASSGNTYTCTFDCTWYKKLKAVHMTGKKKAAALSCPLFLQSTWLTSACSFSYLPGSVTLPLSESLYYSVEHREPCVVPDLYYANTCCQLVLCSTSMWINRWDESGTVSLLFHLHITWVLRYTLSSEARRLWFTCLCLAMWWWSMYYAR